MQQDVILAGVGGQGILTVAQAISTTAVRRGWHVRQAEVHGMAQRGGAVQSHLRFGPHEIWSDLVSVGEADVILAVEPLEALRYTHYLGSNGWIVAGANPFVNIPDYPSVEDILDRVAEAPHHVLVDAERLARTAGSARAVNMVMLGAASGLLGLELAELEAAIAEMFGRKGDSVVRTNVRACELGRRASEAYLDGLSRGIAPRRVREWVDSLTLEETSVGDGTQASTPDFGSEPCALTRAETQAVAQLMDVVVQQDRRQLFEHEVYRMVELVGAVFPPMYELVRRGQKLSETELARFPGDRVVLKLVSPDVVHKTEARAVVFVPKEADKVNAEIARMIERAAGRTQHIEGVLVVEFVAQGGGGFGRELFVGIRSTREFGPIIAAGLGGVDTEYLASKMKPGAATAKALAVETTPEAFFEQFQKTAAYQILSGQARGHERVISDGHLLRCFRAFMAIARRFCVFRGEEGPDMRELEVNPFAFRGHRMIPLDGRGRLGPAAIAVTPRPVSKIARMLEPESIALLGVSSKRRNFGRIILDNILACGFDKERIHVIKPGSERLAGVCCVPSVDELPEKIDMLVVTTPSDKLLDVAREVTRSRKVGSVILVPGGAGETAGTQDTKERLRELIVASRDRADEGPIVLGPNCMGVRSRPGRYDTFFIPDEKLDPRRGSKPRRVAILSQSGAFIVSRMSNLEFLDPAICVSLGNQIDLTVSDLLRGVGDRDDIDCIGAYVEGFNNLDGSVFVRAVEEVTASGKVVVFYKAGRTTPGREATAGHTASLAGDYDVCQTAIAQAGAIVTDTFKEFEQLMELGSALHEKQVSGRRIGVISNAGFETVGMADAIIGARYQVDIPSLSGATAERITAALQSSGIDGLVNVRNPLDLTPMADEVAYEACVQAMIEDAELDAVIVSLVPMTPQLKTTAEEIEDPTSLAARLPQWCAAADKPVIVVVDSGSRFDPLVRVIRSGGAVVFRSADQAVRSLGRYLCHRGEHPRAATPSSEGAVKRIPQPV